MSERRHQSDLTQNFSLGKFTTDGYERGAPLIWQVLWMLASSTLVKQWWLPNSARIKILRFFGSEIGSGVIIRHNVKIHWPWKLLIGDDTWVGEDVWILNLEPVTIGRDVCISQGVMLCTGSHQRRSSNFAFDNGPIAIGDTVWIAARATILRGVSIGSNTTIGATCLITRDISPHSVVLAPVPVIR